MNRLPGQLRGFLMPDCHRGIKRNVIDALGGGARDVFFHVKLKGAVDNATMAALNATIDKFGPSSVVYRNESLDAARRKAFLLGLNTTCGLPKHGICRDGIATSSAASVETWGRRGHRPRRGSTSATASRRSLTPRSGAAESTTLSSSCASTSSTARRGPESASFTLFGRHHGLPFTSNAGNVAGVGWLCHVN